MANGLVYIGRVTNIYPIPEADRIESLEVVAGTGGKWRGTALKQTFHEGDSCLVYLSDSLLPHTDDLAFMEKYHWRVRMQRFRGVPSEVLIMPQTIPGDIGDDVTDLAGVTKHEKPIPASLGGVAIGYFPSFIPRTDEPNFQKVPELVAALRGKTFYGSTKYDGSSATVFLQDGVLHCCSRNLDLKEAPNNVIWQLVRKYKIGETLQTLNTTLSPSVFALQFEVVGPGVQGNPLGLPQYEPRLFDVYNITDHEYFDPRAMQLIAKTHNIPAVEIIDMGRIFDFPDDESLRKYAEGTYPNGTQREGVVIRSVDNERVDGVRLSLKICNLLYKDRV